MLKQLFKILLKTAITVAYISLYTAFSIITYIVPGKCENCHRISLFRRCAIDNNDTPVSFCKKCAEYKDQIIPDREDWE